MRMLTLALCTVTLAACAGGGRRQPVDQDPQRARAALATLFVQNEYGSTLAILYRTGGRAGADVGVGQVPTGATAEMAPVPAGEPLILIARDANGAELLLPPRTFELDGAWTWRITRDAPFVRTGEP